MKLLKEVNEIKIDRIILVCIIFILSVLYLFLAALPKHSDFYFICRMSTNFAIHGLNFIDAVNGGKIDYPPTFFVLQGIWIKIGSLIFNYDMTKIVSNEFPSIFPLWGMIPLIACLFIFVIVVYYTLKNKWLTLLCFGTFSFVSVIIMGQTDIFYALFIYLSMFFLLKIIKVRSYKFYLLLSFISLGVSLQFKIFGMFLLPVFILFSYSLYKSKAVTFIITLRDMLIYIVAFFVSAFIVWAPFIKWLIPVYILGTSGTGENRFLFSLQLASVGLPPLHIISVWLFGYIFIFYIIYKKMIKSPELIIKDERYLIFYLFTVIAWFFIASYNHPQWWVLLLVPVLFILDNYRSKTNYLIAFFVMLFFIFYPMMWSSKLWAGNLDTIVISYLPVVDITGQNSTILGTTIVTFLFIWIVELYSEIYGVDDVKEQITSEEFYKKIHFEKIVPLLISLMPFVISFVLGNLILLARGQP